MISSFFRSVTSGRNSDNFKAVAPRASSGAVSLEGYGDHLFKGAVATPYLEKQGLSATTLENGKWATDGNADKVSFSTLALSNSIFKIYFFLLGRCCCLRVGERQWCICILSLVSTSRCFWTSSRPDWPSSTDNVRVRQERQGCLGLQRKEYLERRD
jgi:hypothetical protein